MILWPSATTIGTPSLRFNDKNGLSWINAQPRIADPYNGCIRRRPFTLIPQDEHISLLPPLVIAPIDGHDGQRSGCVIGGGGRVPTSSAKGPGCRLHARLVYV